MKDAMPEGLIGAASLTHTEEVICRPTHHTLSEDDIDSLLNFFR